MKRAEKHGRAGTAAAACGLKCGACKRKICTGARALRMRDEGRGTNK